MPRRYELAEPKPPSKPKRPKHVRGSGWVYRVAWQRRTGNGLLRPKYKHFLTFDRALRFWRMFGPAPWRYFRNRMNPEDRWPCRDCDRGKRSIVRVDYSKAEGEPARSWEEEVDCDKCFGGVTVRDYIRLRRLELPEIEWIRIERRPVGAWEEVDAQWEEDGVTTGEDLVRVESPEERAVRLRQWRIELLREGAEGQNDPW